MSACCTSGLDRLVHYFIDEIDELRDEVDDLSAKLDKSPEAAADVLPVDIRDFLEGMARAVALYPDEADEQYVSTSVAVYHTAKKLLEKYG